MSFVFKLLSWWPLWLLHGVGAVLGWLAFLWPSVYRDRFIAHARLMGLSNWQIWQAAGHAGRTALELPRLWFGRPVSVRFEGKSHIEAALQSGRGMVFLTPHLGSFEVTAQTYASHFGSAHPITVLYRPSKIEAFEELTANARKRPGLGAAPTTLAGVKQLLKALKAGNAVGILPDQVPPLGLGTWAPFLGRSAYSMTLPAKLVAQTGATVLLAWGERLSWGRGYVLWVEPLNEPLPKDLDAAAYRVNAAMEDLIRRKPTQYLWAYERFRPPPPFEQFR